MNTNRQPAGTSIGGQWAPGSAGEVEMDLDDAFDDSAGDGYVSHHQYGDVDLGLVERSAARQGWGEVNNVTEVAPGIAFADCAGHGGFRLSPERNKEIPRPLRRTWYEEDCESSIVGMYHPEAFPHVDPNDHYRSVRDYFPDEYEKATGEELEFGQSYIRDEQDYMAHHADDWHVRFAQQISDEDGMVKVGYAKNGQERQVKMPTSQYRMLSESLPPYGRYQPHSATLSDEQIDRYPDITEVKPEPEPTPRYKGVDTSGLTPRQQARAEAELSAKMRFSDSGEVTTLAREAEAGRIEGKRVYFNDVTGKTEYQVHRSTTPEGVPATDNSVYPVTVSKATWDSFEAPDERTPREIAVTKMRRARFRKRKAMDRGDVAAFDRAVADEEKAGKEIKDMREQ